MMPTADLSDLTSARPLVDTYVSVRASLLDHWDST